MSLENPEILDEGLFDDITSGIKGLVSKFKKPAAPAPAAKAAPSAEEKSDAEKTAVERGFNQVLGNIAKVIEIFSPDNKLTVPKQSLMYINNVINSAVSSLGQFQSRLFKALDIKDDDQLQSEKPHYFERYSGVLQDMAAVGELLKSGGQQLLTDPRMKQELIKNLTRLSGGIKDLIEINSIKFAARRPGSRRPEIKFETVIRRKLNTMINELATMRKQGKFMELL